MENQGGDPLVDDSSLELRDYQRELLALSREKNICIFLRTGAGKTLISVRRIREVAQADRDAVAGDEGRPKRAVIFVVPTNALAQQQFNYINTHVGGITAELCVGASSLKGKVLDNWDLNDWHALLQTRDCLVMTGGALHSALKRGMLSLRRCSMLVLDEAHHCSKEHDYAKIMENFYHTLPAAERPRVLGLTASPIKTAPKGGAAQGATPLSVQELNVLARRMDCEIVSRGDAAGLDLARFAPTAVVEPLEYDLQGAGLSPEAATLLSVAISLTKKAGLRVRALEVAAAKRASLSVPDPFSGASGLSGDSAYLWRGTGPSDSSPFKMLWTSLMETKQFLGRLLDLAQTLGIYPALLAFNAYLPPSSDVSNPWGSGWGNQKPDVERDTLARLELSDILGLDRQETLGWLSMEEMTLMEHQSRGNGQGKGVPPPAGHPVFNYGPLGESLKTMVKSYNRTDIITPLDVLEGLSQSLCEVVVALFQVAVFSKTATMEALRAQANDVPKPPPERNRRPGEEPPPKDERDLLLADLEALAAVCKADSRASPTRLKPGRGLGAHEIGPYLDFEGPFFSLVDPASGWLFSEPASGEALQANMGYAAVRARLSRVVRCIINSLDIQRVDRDARGCLDPRGKNDILVPLLTPKARAVVAVLEGAKNRKLAAGQPAPSSAAGSRPAAGRVLIFANARAEAEVVKELARRIPCLEGLKVGKFVTGNNASAALAMTVHEQSEAVEAFRSGELDCLCCTSVAEEGIDIPACNLILCLHMVMTTKSYIQIRGRARAHDSRMLVMFPRGCFKSRGILESHERMEENLKQATKEGAGAEDEEDEDAVMAGEWGKGPEPLRTDKGACVFLSDAVGHLNLYVQQLPRDRYQAPRAIPMLEPKIDPRNPSNILRRCTWILPSGAPFSAHVGPWRGSKTLAKAWAAFEVLKKVMEGGHFDDHLRPVDRRAGARGNGGPGSGDGGPGPGSAKGPHVLSLPKTLPLPDCLTAPNSLFGSGVSGAAVTLHLYLMGGATGLAGKGASLVALPTEIPRRMIHSSSGPLLRRAGLSIRYLGSSTQPPADIEALLSWHLAAFKVLTRRKRWGFIGNNNNAEAAVGGNRSSLETLRLALAAEAQEPSDAGSGPELWIGLPVSESRLADLCGDRAASGPVPVTGSLADTLLAESLRHVAFWREEVGKTAEQWLQEPRSGHALRPAPIVSPSHRQGSDFFLLQVEDGAQMMEAGQPIPGGVRRAGGAAEEKTFQAYFQDRYGIQLQARSPLLEIITVPHLSLALSDLAPDLSDAASEDLGAEEGGDVEDPELTTAAPVSTAAAGSGSGGSRLKKSSFLPSRLCLMTGFREGDLDGVRMAPLRIWRLKAAHNAWTLALALKPVLEGAQPQGQEPQDRMDMDEGEASEAEAAAGSEPEPRPSPLSLLASLLLEAVTPGAAGEPYSFETLECLGDATLKLLSSLHIFITWPEAYEEALSEARKLHVSNVALGEAARKTGLAARLRGANFFKQIKVPGLVRKQPAGAQQPIASQDDLTAAAAAAPTTISLRAKTWSDMMEGIIGAAFEWGREAGTGGLVAAARFLVSAGILPPDTALIAAAGAAAKAGRKGRGRRGSDTDGEVLPGLQAVLDSLPYEGHNGRSDPDPSRPLTHPRFVDSLERTLNRDFRRAHLVTQAMTHVSAAAGGAEPVLNNQRLEWLGDAVLDWMVCLHYYRSCPSPTPYLLTIARACLCNNAHLGSVALALGLHRHLQHFNPQLGTDVDEFERRARPIMERLNVPILSSEELPSGVERTVLASFSSRPEKRRATEGVGDRPDASQGLTATGRGGNEPPSAEEIDEIWFENYYGGASAPGQQPGPSDRPAGCPAPPKPLSDAFEALVGALFLDTGGKLGPTWVEVQRWLAKLHGGRMPGADSLESGGKHPKSILGELASRAGIEVVYETLPESQTRGSSFDARGGGRFGIVALVRPAASAVRAQGQDSGRSDAESKARAKCARLAEVAQTTHGAQLEPLASAPSRRGFLPIAVGRGPTKLEAEKSAALGGLRTWRIAGRG